MPTSFLLEAPQERKCYILALYLVCLWKQMRRILHQESVHVVKSSRNQRTLDRPTRSPAAATKQWFQIHSMNDIVVLCCHWPSKKVFLSVNPIYTGLFWFSCNPGGADLPPPSKNGGNGWEVPKLSWNLISYRDWCQRKGFTTFGYPEPP